MVRTREMAWLRRHGWLAAIAIAYLWAFPYFPRIQSANELPRIYLVKAIADDHGFAIDRGVARWGATADVSPSGGHHYSNKAPGSSMLAAAPYWVLHIASGDEPGLAASLWLARVVAGVIPTLLFLGLLYRFLARFVPDPAIRQVACLAYGVGSMAMTYSVLFYSHQLAACCIGSAWIVAVEAARGERRERAFAAGGALAGCALLVDYQAVFAALPIAVHALVTLRARRGRAVALAIAGAAAPIAILLAYHAVCFGSPWRTGYDASTTFAVHHQQGFLGVTALRWEAFVGSTVALDNGLVALAPWVALAVPGSFALARGLHAPRGTPVPVAAPDRMRAWLELGAAALLLAIAIGVGVATRGGGSGRAVGLALAIAASGALVVRGAARRFPRRPGADPATALVGLAVAAIYLLFVTSINFWRGGWGVGPRYVTAMLPFLVPAVAVLIATLRHAPIWRGVALGLCTTGIAIYVLSTFTFPYWPDSVRHPLVDVTLRLLGDGVVAPNVGAAVGIPGVLGIAPAIAIVAAASGAAIARIGGWRAVAIAAATTVVIFACYALAPHGGAKADQVYAFVRAAM